MYPGGCNVVKLIPLEPNSKEPLKGRSWKKTMSSDPAVWQQWLAAGLNIGMPTGKPNDGIMAVDYDDRESAVCFFRENRERIKAITTTPRGGAHFFFHGDGPNAHGKPDIRGTGGYVVRAGSSISGKVYRDVPGYELRSAEQLTEFQQMWYPKQKEVTNQSKREVRNVNRYIMGIFAYGSKGHDDAYSAACVLRDNGVPEVDALVAMYEWNKTNADPPFTMKELHHKIYDAYRMRNA